MRQKVVLALFRASVILAIISTCCLDSISNIPMVVLSICLVYIGLFTVANTVERGDKNDEN